MFTLSIFLNLKVHGTFKMVRGCYFLIRRQWAIFSALILDMNGRFQTLTDHGSQ